MYFICGTPRTGSTLLCSLLKSTGVAGRPESYFREPGEAMWADRWSLRSSGYGSIEYAAFVQAAITAGTTPNGVLGVRVMWGTMERIVAGLRAIHGDEVSGDSQLLARAFGAHMRFLHLRREDVVAQAVSWARSEQTGFWHPGDTLSAEPIYDFGQIDDIVRMINEHNRAWQSWFEQIGVHPYEIAYEHLAADPVGIARAVHEHLDIEPASGRPITATDRKQADQINADWVCRYRDEGSSS